MKYWPMLKKNIKINLTNVTLVLTTLLFTFIISECVLRLINEKPVFAITDYRGDISNLYKSAMPVRFNPFLGWIPKEGFTSKINAWQKQVTILENGVRSNDNIDSNGLSDSMPILIVGDSFTFGDQVSNHETYPAILEKLLRKKVINAGVFAYGIDQSYLRLISLLDIYNPDVVIFSFIPSDIRRCEYSTIIGANKPYFEIKNSKLFLKNSPVTQATVKKIGPIRFLLGHSYLIHAIMIKLAPNWWLQGGYRWSENRVRNRGEEVACKIFQSLDAILQKRNIDKSYILIQYEQHELLDNDPQLSCVKYCINQTSMKILDLKGYLLDKKKNDPSLYNSFFCPSHMSYYGNFFVASLLKELIINNNKE